MSSAQTRRKAAWGLSLAFHPFLVGLDEKMDHIQNRPFYIRGPRLIHLGYYLVTGIQNNDLLN